MLIDKSFLAATFFKSLAAVPVTMNIVLVSTVLAFPMALAIAWARIKRAQPLAAIGTAAVSFLRGTPIVLQILIVYSLLPSLFNALCKRFLTAVNVFDIDPIIYAYVVFTLNTMAVMSEVLRSGILSVPQSQYDAALCLGLTPVCVWRNVILPQAIGNSIPNLCNLTVALIKNTSLAFMMAVKDVTAVAKVEAAFGYNYIEAYLDIFAVYVIVCSVVQAVFKCVECKVSHR